MATVVDFEAYRQAHPARQAPQNLAPVPAERPVTMHDREHRLRMLEHLTRLKAAPRTPTPGVLEF